ncbi:MAG: SulP family inorganic anion transporter [Propionicimonas sp.]|nr:SulP family inorganic anion transporter [Propionicimonas sp.]
MSRRGRSWAPGLAVLTGYDRTWLRGDLLAGATVAAYLVPQVMAYAEIAGLPAVVGLWAAIPSMLVYAVIGGSPQLSIGPESTTALLTAAGVGALVAGAGADRYAEVAALLAIAVGVVCLVGWIARLGFLSNLLSHPVLVGYLAGIAVLMMVSQLGNLTGLQLSGDTIWQEVASLAGQWQAVHLPTLALSAVVLALLFGFHRLLPTWPGPLVAMLIAASVIWLGVPGTESIAVVGAVPSGLPAPRLPMLGDLSLLALLPAALGIAVVGYSDNILTGRAFAIRNDQRIEPTQELLALGAANVATGLFQGFPVSSSGSRTALGDSVGSRTQLHSLVAVAVVVATLFLLGPLLAAFPVPALGAVIVYAALRLVDVAELRRIARFRTSELVLALATTLAVLATGVLVGVGIAIALSLLDLIRRISRPHDGVLGYVPGLAGMHDVQDYPEASVVSGLLVYRYDSPLFFANAEDFRARALAAVDDATPPVHWFLLNAEANIEVDLTAVDALEEVRATLAGRGIEFALARVKFEVHQQLEAAGFVERLGRDRVFATLPTGVEAYQRWHRDTYAADPATHPAPGHPDGLDGTRPED